MGGLLSQLASAGVVLGDQLDDGQDLPIYLWPECVEAWGHWQRLQTQWRVGGMGGATGLDYAGVRAYFDERGIEPGPERLELFDCIRECELACLEVWEELRAKEAAARPPSTRP